METPRHRAVIDAMARAIRDAGSDGLITFHPVGGHDSTEYVLDADYIQLHTAQTGHDVQLCYKSDDVMARMRRRSPLPYLDSEPRYEDHPACFDAALGFYWGEAEVRQNLYWDLFAGACGHTYGNHCIWSFNKTPSDYFPYDWKTALGHPGAWQMRHAVNLRLRRDYFSLEPAQEMVLQQYPGEGHIAAARGKGYAYFYSPLGLAIYAEISSIGHHRLRALWFDPRTGEETVAGIVSGIQPSTFVPPTQGKGCDWILILEVC